MSVENNNINGKTAVEDDDSSSSGFIWPELEEKEFGRRNRGRLMGKMIERAPKPDSFWDEQGEMFEEEEEDDDFDEEKDEDFGFVESVDSDFSESESEAEAEQVEKERPQKKAKQTYKDPKLMKKKSAASAASTTKGSEPKKKRVKKTIVVPKSDRVVRDSTAARTVQTNLNLEMQPKKKKPRKKRVVRQLTQEEILAEAAETERLNTESLHAIIQWEEDERAKRKKKGPVLTGPRVVSMSKGTQTILTFKDCDGHLPAFLGSIDGKTNAPIPVKKKTPKQLAALQKKQQQSDINVAGMAEDEATAPVGKKGRKRGRKKGARGSRKKATRKKSNSRAARRPPQNAEPPVERRTRSSRKVKMRRSADFDYDVAY